MSQLITAQHYLDDEIIAAKRDARDYAVLVSPEFAVGGETYRVVLDGNHSLAAAVADGVAPEIEVADATAHDAVALLDQGNIDDFLARLHMGEGDYIDAVTREYVW